MVKQNREFLDLKQTTMALFEITFPLTLTLDRTKTVKFTMSKIMLS